VSSPGRVPFRGETGKRAALVSLAGIAAIVTGNAGTNAVTGEPLEGSGITLRRVTTPVSGPDRMGAVSSRSGPVTASRHAVGKG
jgi:hypothetical protein